MVSRKRGEKRKKGGKLLGCLLLGFDCCWLFRETISYWLLIIGCWFKPEANREGAGAEAEDHDKCPEK